jgi:anhydro-N-acetylmuramic acid kinase
MGFNGPMPPSSPADPAFLSDGDLVAGVLSGTSADGIDVAVCRVGVEADGQRQRICSVEATAMATVPMGAGLARRVRAILDGGPIELPALAALDRDLGLAFGAAAREVAGPGAPLVLVASHGQTVFHHDGDPALGKVTLQLGDGDFVAEAAGCSVASDFRTRDCAAGGEGAPLVVLVDEVLFAGAARPLSILNLGGIANWTLLRPDGPPTGSDAGPAGALLDGLARLVLDRPMDRDGSAAARGARPEDLLATATRFVARSAAADLLGGGRCGSATAGLEVAVAGGGARNPVLMGALEQELSAGLAARGARLSGFGPSDRHGVPPDFREAMAFAVFGARLAVGEASTRPEVTGASAGRVLGKWSRGGPGAR